MGEMLLNVVNEYALAENCSRLFLSTTPFLHGAIRLYENFGFKRIAEGPHDLYGTPLFSMEKTLIR
jgi:GNAT superfamily N-acetyltransferase